MNQNGRIFIDTSTTPHKGVEIADLQQVLGVSGNDLGQIISRGGATEAINKWSIHKPERNAKLGILTLAERQDNSFGLDIPMCTSTTGIASFMSGYASGYNYLTPSGKKSIPSQNEWFRILDFDGYNHNANCFVNTNDLTLPTSYIVGVGGTGIYFHIGINNGNNLQADSISISDLKLGGSEGTAFGSLYFGILFTDGSAYKLITSSNTLATDVNTYGGGEVSLSESGGSLSGLTTGVTYSYYPVLSLLPHPSMSNITQQDTIVALPNLSPRSFKASQATAQQAVSILECDATLTAIQARLFIDFVVGMSATGGAPTSMTANYVIYAASGVGDESGAQLASGTITNLTTTQSQEVQRTLNVTNPQWVRVYVYNSINSSVNTQAWAQVVNEPLPD